MPDANAHSRGDDDALSFLRELIEAGRDGEDAVQRRVAGELERLGCAVETVRYRPADVPMVEEFADTTAMDAGERASIVGRLKGQGGGRSLILFAHPDSEPVAGTERWRHDPFAGIVADGRIHGWGVADDLAGVAAMVEGLRLLLASGRRPAGDIIVASTPSKRHARGVSALLHGGLAADAALYLHPAESGAGMREVKAFASGQLDFRVAVEGRAPATTEPHQTGFAHRAVNAVDKVLLIGRALQTLDEARAGRVRHPRLEAAVGRSTNLMLSHLAAGDPDRLSRSPVTAMIGAALSFPPPETLSQVRREVEEAVRAVADADDWLREHPPRLLWDSGVTGAEVPEESALWRVVVQAVTEQCGEAPFVNPMHTSSDIRNPMVQKGIPTVGLGPLCGDLSQNGGTDEWVDVADYLRSVRVAAAIMAGWCGASTLSVA